MVGEYISREDVCIQLLKQESIDGQPRAIRRARRIVENIPAADVVEVVRCGECIRKDICRTSNVWAVSPDDNWFCADGKRKDGGQGE